MQNYSQFMLSILLISNISPYGLPIVKGLPVQHDQQYPETNNKLAT